jgi:hypothetical protein
MDYNTIAIFPVPIVPRLHFHLSIVFNRHDNLINTNYPKQRLKPPLYHNHTTRILCIWARTTPLQHSHLILALNLHLPSPSDYTVNRMESIPIRSGTYIIRNAKTKNMAAMLASEGQGVWAMTDLPTHDKLLSVVRKLAFCTRATTSRVPQVGYCKTR